MPPARSRRRCSRTCARCRGCGLRPHTTGSGAAGWTARSRGCSGVGECVLEIRRFDARELLPRGDLLSDRHRDRRDATVAAEVKARLPGGVDRAGDRDRLRDARLLSLGRAVRHGRRCRCCRGRSGPRRRRGPPPGRWRGAARSTVAGGEALKKATTSVSTLRTGFRVTTMSPPKRPRPPRRRRR